MKAPIIKEAKITIAVNRMASFFEGQLTFSISDRTSLKKANGLAS